MADVVINKATSLVLLSFFLLPCLTNGSGKGSWCMLLLGASEAAQQANIQYACGGGITDCSAIQEGGSCYSQDPGRQACYAMNAYYFAAGHKDINCYFNGTDDIIHTDPRYLNCDYPS